MAIGNASLTLNIIAEDTVLKRVLRDAKRNVNTFSKDVEKAGKKNQAAQAGFFGGGLGRGSKVNQGLRGLASGTGLGSAALFGSGPFIGAALGAGAFKASVDAASDLNEQLTKSNQVFGQNAKAVTDWSKSTAKDLGISRVAALQAAGTFGNLFKAQGIGSARNSQLSRNLVSLAADLASFNNVDPTQVLEDLNSAIVGEIEPVRKYGADLRVARVQQEALAETGKDNVKQLTRQELTLARVALLYRDTAAAQGDFKRTQGGLANQQRILTAQVQDLAGNLGTLLLPAVKGMVTGLNELLSVANLAARGLQKIADIKIPAIHIPLLFDIGGGKVGSIVGGAAKLGGLLAVSPAGAIAFAVKKGVDELTGAAKDATSSAAPKLKKDMEDIFNPFFTNAISASENVKGFLKLPKGSAKKQFESLIDALNLNLSKSDLTQTAADNISILKDLVIAYKAQIKAGVDVKNARENLVSTQKALQEAVTGAKSTKFSDIIDSLNLGVEKSQITGSVGQQLSTLNALKSGLEKQIKAGVDVQSAQHQLVAVEGQIASLQKQVKEDGIQKILSALQLGVDKAALTKGLGDDLKALEQQRDGLRAQIKAGNDVANNASQLVGVMQAIADKKAEIAQKASDALQAKQFRALGLSATGDEIVPGLANLSKRINETLNKVSSGELDISSKLASRLKSARNLIRKEGDNLTNTTREKINEFIRAANGDDAKNKINGPLTATTSLNTNKILKGLGIDTTDAKELKARLSNFNSAGVGLSAGVTASAAGVAFGAGAPNVIVNVELDGQKVARSVTVHQQKRARSNPTQKRGPIGGRI